MTQDASATRTDCDADSNLMLARNGSRKHQASEIGACDGKDEQREHGHHRGDAIHFGLHDLQVATGRALDEFVFPDRLGMLLAELVCQGAQFLLGRFGADTGRKTAPHADSRVAPVSKGVAAFDEIGLLRNRHP